MFEKPNCGNCKNKGTPVCLHCKVIVEPDYHEDDSRTVPFFKPNRTEWEYKEYEENH